MQDIEEYRKLIKYSKDITEKLDICELILLLTELIDDEQISKEVDKYLDDFETWYALSDTLYRNYVDLKEKMERFK